MNTDTSKTKRQWCAMLAKMTSPMAGEDAGQAFIAMLPFLDQGDDVYNRDTLEAAARRDTGDPAVPNFDKIARVFASWRRERLPIRVRMGGAPPDAPRLPAPTYERTDADRAHVEEVVRQLKTEAEIDRPAVSKIEPKYLNKLQLARSAPPEVLASRPDYRAALGMAIAGGGGDAYREAAE